MFNRSRGVAPKPQQKHAAASGSNPGHRATGYKPLLTRPTLSARLHAFFARKDQHNPGIHSLVIGVWLRSLVGLTLIAILATSTYFIIHSMLTINESSGTIVNISGRQRMLSQRGALFALELASSEKQAEQENTREELQKVVDLMLSSHLGLTQGSQEMGLPDTMSETMRKLYFEKPDQLDSQVKRYLDEINALIRDSRTGTVNYSNPHLQYILTAAPDRLLKTLNAAVKQYETEAGEQIQNAIRYEMLVYLVTLLTLLLEALLIYRPLVNRVRSTTENLVRQQEFSDSVINTSQALIIGLDKQGKVSLFNAYSQALSGYHEDAVIGRDFLDTFIPPDKRQQMRELHANLFTDKSSQRFEAPLLTVNGKTLIVEWSKTSLFDPVTRQPTLLLATGIDITLRKKTEFALKAALKQTKALSARLREEVAHAAVLQRALLPPPDITLPGLQGLACLTTSTEVGGDYYDYYAVGDYYSVFLVGDVSGHGVAAGTLVSAAKMGVHQLASRGETDPALMLEHLNAALLTASHESMFMTMVCCCLDSRTGNLRVANAGHAFPYLWMAAEQEWGMIEAEGLPLGRVQLPQYTTQSFDMEPGDRLFLYTDGILEEENASAEAFGYERLEGLLYETGNSPLQQAHETLFNSLKAFSGQEHFHDDVTLMMVEHTERVTAIAVEEPVGLQAVASQELRQIDAATLLGQPGALAEHTARQYVVLTCHEGQLDDLLIPMCRFGIRRILPEDQPFLRELGWQNLLRQHQLTLTDDIYQWLPNPALHREWVLHHSDDKAFIMQEIGSLLAESAQVSEEVQDVVLLMSDELLENSLYGAPRNDQGAPRFVKGGGRQVGAEEGIRITLSQDTSRLGLMVTDHWGTLTPSTFLNRLFLNAAHQGIEAGVGGAGMYLMWRTCDYLQIRVLPNRKTQVTLLWSLAHLPDPETDSGFQFLYHNDLDERVANDELSQFETNHGDDKQATIKGNEDEYESEYEYA
ncbi:MAG: SpoIIE family protein phosphatase [Thiothrix sp.]